MKNRRNIIAKGFGFCRVRLQKIIRKHIQERTWWYVLQYHIFFLLNKLIIFLIAIRKDRVATSNKHVGREVKRVLLVYSKNHFDPQNDDPKRRLSASSAANIARNIFFALEKDREVIYVDANEPVRDGLTDIDLVVGILSKGFLKYCKKFPAARKTLFLVNSHPLFRLKELINESRTQKHTLSFSEYVSPRLFLKTIKYCDQMILIGNDFVKETYVRYGIQGKNIKLINSGVNVGTLLPDHKKWPPKKINIVFPASHVGIRKGLFRVIEIWEKLSQKFSSDNISLIIIGGSVGYEKVVNDFVKKYPNVTYCGWVDSTSDQYRELLQSSQIILSPSLEEGQVGTVLEAMACGSVPVITNQCGIPIKDGQEGFVAENVRKIDKMVEDITFLIQNRGRLEDFSFRARTYVDTNFKWEDFRDRFRRICLNGADNINITHE